MANERQVKIIELLRKEIIDAGFEALLVPNFSNTGYISIEKEGEFGAFGRITYDFQRDNFNLVLEWNGVKIPSQPGRAGYFDWYFQSRDERAMWSQFIACLRSHITPAKRVSKRK